MKSTLSFMLLIAIMGFLYGQTVSIPHTQDFDDLVFPQPQSGWVVRAADSDAFDWYRFEGAVRSDSYISGVGNLHPDNWLISPSFQFVTGRTYTVRFDWKQYTGNYTDRLSVYTMAGNTSGDCSSENANTVQLWSEVTSSSEWQTVVVSYTPSATVTRFIGFRHHNSYAQWSVMIDNVSIYENVDHDLYAVRLSGPTIYNSNNEYTLTIYNNGDLDVADGDYSIQMYRIVVDNPDALLGDAITETPAILSLGKVEFPISAASWALDSPTETTHQIYAKIVYSTDTTPINNTSNTIGFTVLPSSLTVVDLMTAGANTVVNTHPVNYRYNYSVSQVIFTATQLHDLFSFGQITNISLRFFNYNVPDGLPVQIYLANAPTNLNTFTSPTAWYPFEHFTKVYDNPLPIGNTTGQGAVKQFMIEIGAGNGADSEDFYYLGENLIMMMHRRDTVYYSYYNAWHHNPGNTNINRALYYNTDSPGIINITNLSNLVGTQDISYPKVMFYIDHKAPGTLNGGVYIAGTNPNEPPVPIENAMISVANNPAMFTYTNDVGLYNLPNIFTDSAINVTAFGYVSQSIATSEIPWVDDDDVWFATKEIYLVARTDNVRQISGIVKVNDSNSAINGVEVVLTGYCEPTTTTTGTNGNFSFSSLYANETYTITINHPGYNPYTQEINVGNDNVVGIEIVLTETIQPPLAVFASEHPTLEDTTQLMWLNPLWEHTSFSYARPAFDNGVSANSGGASVFTIAHRYLGSYFQGLGIGGFDLYKVSFIPYIDTASYTVKIWTTTNPYLANPGTLEPLCVIPVANIVAQQLNEVALPFPIPLPPQLDNEGVLIDGQIFVGIEIETSSGYPAAIDYVNQFTRYSDLILEDGLWQFGSVLGIPGAWCIYLSAVAPEVEEVEPPTPMMYSREIDAPTSQSTNVSTQLSAHNPGFTTSIDNLYLGRTPNRVTRAFSGAFEVYRMAYTANIPNSPLETVTIPDINNRNMYYIDTTWDTLPPQIYKYAVTAVYTGSAYPGTGNKSDPMYSNNILNLQRGTVTVNVSMQQISLAGAVISMSSSDVEIPDLEYTLTTIDAGTHIFDDVYLNKAYDVTVTTSNMTLYSRSHTFSEINSVLNISLLASDIIHSETFNGTQPIGWANIDADNDGYLWKFNLNTDEFAGVNDGSTAAYSESYCNDNLECVFPDNWLISPPIELPSESDIFFEFFVAAVNPLHPSDRLLVYITSVSDSEIGWELFLQNRQTITGLTSPGPASETLFGDTTLLTDFIVTDDEYSAKNFDISEYAGQFVRVAFRHAFCQDMFAVKISNMTISSASYVPVRVTGSVVTMVDNVAVPVPNATVSISTANTISTTTSNNGTFVLNNVPGDATYTVIVTKTGYIENNSTQITVSLADHDISTPIMLVIDPTSDSDITSPILTTLKANYPNPFNPTTTIAFDTHKKGHVTVDIYNVKGQKVKTVANSVLEAGSHKVVWNGQDDNGHSVSSGIYFYRMQTEGYRAVKKMVLMK